jgi:hypothetical protein
MMDQNAAPRRGHTGIKAILDDMMAVLLTKCVRQAEESPEPSKQYRELQQLEAAFRKRLLDMKASKGIPAKMQACLDELRDAIAEALERGVDTDYMIAAYEKMVVTPLPSLQEQTLKRPERMVTETRYRKVCEELKEEKRKNTALNKENNELVMRIKRMEAMWR